MSIGFPVYNAESFIAQALDKILAQGYKDFEIVICDNASSDRTPVICQQYAARDPRIRFFRNSKNLGVNANHDRVFQLSRGTYFTWTAHDVEMMPEMLSQCVAVISSAPASVVLVYAGCEIVRDGAVLAPDQQGSIATKNSRPCSRLEWVVRHLYFVNQLYGLIRSDALRQTRLNGRYASSDFVLLAELAMLGQIWEIPRVLLRRKIDSDRGTAAVLHDVKQWAKWSGESRHDVLGLLPLRPRLAVEYFRAAWHVPLRISDKVPCLLLAPLLPYLRTLLRITGPSRYRLRRLLGRPSNPVVAQP